LTFLVVTQPKLALVSQRSLLTRTSQANLRHNIL
jgi:hypothetical protein